MELAQVAGGAERIVVVDSETTGIYDSDRVVEIAVVTLSLDGRLVDQWDTLVNPDRAVTATHVHGITDSMVSNAPRFEDIAADLAIRLQGACLAAHNVPFDVRMIDNEYRKVGGSVRADAALDTLTATRAKLPEACAAWGVPFVERHKALDDALACAHLLACVAEVIQPGIPASVYNRLPRTGRMCRRSDVAQFVLPDPPFIAQLAARLDHTSAALAQPEVADRLVAYLDLVDRTIADLHLDPAERVELVDLANRYGLSDADIDYAHRSFVDDLVRAALDDHVVTEEEYDMLLRVAHALGVPIQRVETAVHSYRTADAAVVLTPGMVVTFTGDHPDHPRDAMVDRAAGLGLDVAKSTTKKTQILIAADPSSQSEKARKALQYGVPVIGVAEFAHMTLGDPVGARAVTLESRKVVECPGCRRTWTVAGRTQTRSIQRCEDCK